MQAQFEFSITSFLNSCTNATGWHPPPLRPGSLGGKFARGGTSELAFLRLSGIIGQVAAAAAAAARGHEPCNLQGENTIPLVADCVVECLLPLNFLGIIKHTVHAKCFTLFMSHMTGQWQNSVLP